MPASRATIRDRKAVLDKYKAHREAHKLQTLECCKNWTLLNTMRSRPGESVRVEAKGIAQRRFGAPLNETGVLTRYAK